MKTLIISFLVIFNLGCKNNYISNRHYTNNERLVLLNLNKNLNNHSNFNSIINSININKLKNNSFISEIYFLKCQYFYKNNRDSSFIYLNKSIEICKKGKNDTLLIDLFLYKQKFDNSLDESLNDLLYIDSIALKIKNPNRIARINQELGRLYYFSNPAICEKYFIKAYTNFLIIKDTLNAGYCLQNIGFAYGEQLCDYEKSIKNISNALLLWKESGRIYKQANLKKYLGILYSKMGDSIIAKKNIFEAINQFKSIYDTGGVSVSLYNLAIVYENEKKIDSAIIYLNNAKKYWYKKEDIGRLFSINNNLFLDYLSINQNDSARISFNENESFLKNFKNEITWILKLHFYSNSIIYFKSQGEMDNKLLYENILINYKDSLKSNGYVIPICD